MRNSFNQALQHVFAYEGGFINHPLDPGGATNMGITGKTLAAYRGSSVTIEDVRTLSVYEATNIYRQNYWHRCLCDLIPEGLDLEVFDCAVNQGVRKSIYFLQKSAGVRTDYIIGPVTLSAVRRSNHIEFLNEFTARRMQHYGRLTNLFRTFGLGWSRRLSATHSKSLQLIMESSNELHS